MKARILDYVTESPRSAIEIYDLMCKDGFTYSGKTPQYTTQSKLGLYWKDGHISRKLKERGVRVGGCPREYYYYINECVPLASQQSRFGDGEEQKKIFSLDDFNQVRQSLKSISKTAVTMISELDCLIIKLEKIKKIKRGNV